jgi:hypothetical protein
MVNWLRTHPENWRQDTLDKAALLQAAKSLQGHPQFAAARHAFTHSMGECRAGPWLLHKVLRGDAQFALLATILHLHHYRDPNTPESGVTTKRIIDIFARGAAHGPHCALASPTRIKTMLAVIRYTQGIVPAVSATGQNMDGRYRPYLPTEKMIAPARDWYRAFLHAVNLVLPLPATALDAPECLLAEVMSYNVFAYTKTGFMLHENYPEISACMHRETGHQILMLLIAGMRTEQDGRVVTHAPIDQLAERLKVARGTLRNILNGFAKEALIDVARGGHYIVMSENFVALCNQWVALELTWMYGLTTQAIASQKLAL